MIPAQSWRERLRCWLGRHQWQYVPPLGLLPSLSWCTSCGRERPAS